MTEEEFRKKMQEGLDKMRPIVVQVTGLVMDTYQEGFKNCWELLTGKKFEQ